jgi:hypothetical protein
MTIEQYIQSHPWINWAEIERILKIKPGSIQEWDIVPDRHRKSLGALLYHYGFNTERYARPELIKDGEEVRGFKSLTVKDGVLGSYERRKYAPAKLKNGAWVYVWEKDIKK